MKKYIVGMDGGGTKTAVIAADTAGGILETFEAGALNYNGQDTAKADETLRGIFERLKAFGTPEDCAAICIGTAGISNPFVKKHMEEQVRAAGFSGKLYITGDHEIALYGALGECSGMILIAGTGSICYGRNPAGESWRTGGFGHLIDDEGGGYAIGRDILSAVVKAHDGRTHSTCLTQSVCESLHICSIEELVAFVYKPSLQKKDIAALSALLPDACAKGDSSALKIAQNASAELMRLIYPVAERLKLTEGKIAFSGSVCVHDNYIREELKTLLRKRYPKMEYTPCKCNAAYGAMLFAKEQLVP